MRSRRGLVVLVLAALLSVAGCYGGAYYTGAASDFSYPYPAGYRLSYYDPYWGAPPPYYGAYYPPYPYYYPPYYPYYPPPMMGWWGYYWGGYPPYGSVGTPSRPRRVN